MSGFWSAWVILLIVVNLGITLFLFLWAPRVEIPTQADGTSGHVWAHGVLREGIRRLPTWWIALSAAMFVAGFGYLALYPGFGAFKGVLGWTSSGEHARDTAANATLEAPLLARIKDKPIEALAGDPQVLQHGEVLFVDNCAACHGRDARGNALLGAPDLTDSDWLYGGDGNAILTSILDGRHGGMPAFAGTLKDDAVLAVVDYARSLSGLPHDSLRAQIGRPLFVANCAPCHGADGKGNAAVGAPNLTDAIWLYGSNQADMLETVRGGRGGVMPAWRGRLAEQDARMVAAYVYARSHPDAARR
jgi:cytochrome c oxidase cbb3-type subunit III